MVQRLIRMLLLISVAFWAAGAATYLHERLEHRGADNPTARLAWLRHDRRSHRQHSDPPHHHDSGGDHDDCPTCQLLVHMTATGFSPPAHPPFILLRAFATLTLDWQPPVVLLGSCDSIRGPPCPFDDCAC